MDEPQKCHVCQRDKPEPPDPLVVDPFTWAIRAGWVYNMFTHVWTCDECLAKQEALHGR